jgi:hypothetical protein
MTQQENGSGGHATMPRVVAMMMTTMTRINPCGGNEITKMMTRINPLCTAMMTSNKPSEGNDDQVEQRHDHARSRRSN